MPVVITSEPLKLYFEWIRSNHIVPMVSNAQYDFHVTTTGVRVGARVTAPASNIHPDGMELYSVRGAVRQSYALVTCSSSGCKVLLKSPRHLISNSKILPEYIDSVNRIILSYLFLDLSIELKGNKLILVKGQNWTPIHTMNEVALVLFSGTKLHDNPEVPYSVGLVSPASIVKFWERRRMIDIAKETQMVIKINPLHLQKPTHEECTVETRFDPDKNIGSV